MDIMMVGTATMAGEVVASASTLALAMATSRTASGCAVEPSRQEVRTGGGAIERASTELLRAAWRGGDRQGCRPPRRGW
jgi:hypothetical protein